VNTSEKLDVFKDVYADEDALGQVLAKLLVRLGYTNLPWNGATPRYW